MSKRQSTKRPSNPLPLKTTASLGFSPGRGRCCWRITLFVEEKTLPLEGRKICIDPGHPSEVGIGTKGKKATEVGVAWRMALLVKDLLRERGATIVLTKSREREMVKNRRRAEIANAANADLMLRLHCDAEGRTGASVYYPDRPGRSSDGMRGPSAAVIAISRKAGQAFHPAFRAELNGVFADRGLLTDAQTFIGGKQGALTGSIYSKVPVLLVEMCVLTSPADEAFITSKSGEARMARALAKGAEAAVLATAAPQEPPK
jgi:N-acetylmuramoyl-L-alanine amidase